MMKLYDNDAYREEFMALVYELLDSDGTNDRANQIIDAFDSAPEVEAEPVQPNAPLTLDELREMDGGPVWCVGRSGEGRWGIVHFYDDDGFECYMTEYGRIDGWCYGSDGEYGWLAYRRKPEEGTP